MTVISNDRPAYRILSEKGFFGPDDNLYPFGEQIYFDDEPNLDMEPLNELARKRKAEFINKLEELGRQAAVKNGREFTGLPMNIESAIEQASMDARRVQSISNPDGVALMKADKTHKNTGIGKIADLDTPETKASKGKLSIKRSA